MQVLAIADDTTGALEVGAKLAGLGVRTLVTTLLAGWPDAPALVVDTQSRQLEPAQARERVAAVAMAAREAGVPYLYKKTDSTLRGNIASEFEALMDVFPDRRLVWVPAYPAMGRVLINGELYVDGVPLGQTASAPGAVKVCDGQSDDDLRAVAAALARDVKPSIAAGAAGFRGILGRGAASRARLRGTATAREALPRPQRQPASGIHGADPPGRGGRDRNLLSGR
jgi:uncharacterized protein YgbK (DUF1537 family)